MIGRDSPYRRRGHHFQRVARPSLHVQPPSLQPQSAPVLPTYGTKPAQPTIFGKSRQRQAARTRTPRSCSPPSSSPTMSPHISPDALRGQFAASMSLLFKAEVPLYGELLELVHATNEPRLGPLSQDERGRLGAERHGAIRVGTPQELQTLSRLFALLGMSAVGYASPLRRCSRTPA
mgnify:FL=1